ncbi:MAG: hypothetical protein LAQ69_03465 [Acidobacteriia bacterium]|nr:hypothetical protein [Terriglobia bacterium]
MQQIREDGTLDDHQQGLARLARYPINWQLRQAGLRAIAELQRSIDEVIRVAAQIMIDEKNDLETRILAGGAVSRVLSNGNGTISESARSKAAESVRDLLANTQPPILHRFARRLQESLAAPAGAATTTQ